MKKVVVNSLNKKFIIQEALLNDGLQGQSQTGG